MLDITFSMNFELRVFANIVLHVEDMARRIKDAGVKVELKVFGMVQQATIFCKKA